MAGGPNKFIRNAGKIAIGSFLIAGGTVVVILTLPISGPVLIGAGAVAGAATLTGAIGASAYYTNRSKSDSELSEQTPVIDNVDMQDLMKKFRMETTGNSKINDNINGTQVAINVTRKDVESFSSSKKVDDNNCSDANDDDRSVHPQLQSTRSNEDSTSRYALFEEVERNMQVALNTQYSQRVTQIINEAVENEKVSPSEKDKLLRAAATRILELEKLLQNEDKLIKNLTARLNELERENIDNHDRTNRKEKRMQREIKTIFGELQRLKRNVDHINQLPNTIPFESSDSDSSEDEQFVERPRGVRR